MSSEIDQIKDRLSIVDVVSRYVQLKKAGINHQGLCPFHNEKTPSFYVSAERGTYKCFGCGEGGDIFSFVEKMEGIQFKDALTKLAGDAGVILTQKYTQQSDTKDKKDRYFALMKHIALYWHKQLGANETVKDYLKKRGFTKEIVTNYLIGYAPNDWHASEEYLKTKGFTQEEIEAVGVIKKNEKGSYHDRFRDRIIFPLFDVAGNIVAFSGRYFGQEKDTAKYLNSPETVLFSKSKELYGLHTAKQHIRKNNFALLVEGQVDLIMSQQVYPNTVASSGTALTPSHLQLIKRFCNRVVFVYDGDSAGIEATYRGALIALTLDFEIKIAVLPEGKDPADIASTDKEAYKKMISEALPVFDYYIGYISNKYTGKERTLALEGKILPLIQAAVNPIEQDRYVTMVSEKLSISADSIRQRLAQLKSQTPQQATQQEYASEKTESINIDFERELGLIYAWQRSLKPENQFIKAESILSDINQDVVSNIKSVAENLSEDELGTTSFLLENLYKTAIILDNEVQEIKKRMGQTSLTTKLEVLKQELKEATNKQEKDQIDLIKQNINDLLKKLYVNKEIT